MSEINKTFLVKANEFVFSFDQEEIDKADFIKKNPAEFNLIKDNRSVNAKLLESDIAGKNLKIEVDGETFELVIKDELDQRLDSMGFSSTSTKHIKEIKAPMPGLVLEVAVKEGQEVKEGERILILEAMKMENEIRTVRAGVVKQITCIIGQRVEQNSVLIVLE